MADLPSQFWGGWIVAITVTTFVALAWFVIDVYRGKGGGDNEDMVWDENLREGAKPAPVWWFWFILALMVVSVVYVMLYPGLGTYRGALEWSQGGHIEQRFADYAQEFGEARARILSASTAALAEDEAAMRSAWRVFNNHCASCHGRDAAGQARRFPDLTDAAWQWGVDEAALDTTIRHGRIGVMPPWLAAVGEEGVAQLADYVIALSRGGGGDPAVAPGAALFQQFCVACHGADGSGNRQLGAPALNDTGWTYGGSRADVTATIAQGRNGQMPAFGGRLDDAQIRLLVAWLQAGAKIP
ncbi:MAG: cytochrome-c oxidase, cbb3-type subunit III [Steroidobacteraceae bacterium]|nr:cytochrome-c oxidase, cbb3-type subunit III [Steroidobacteraceae bacterium]